ncbi:MAG: CAP domain-containing protein [Chitinophagaceae bacterium]|nr:CAP domain-containing protein [Chitinophagaceae bacterium]MEA3424940.1 CAP domain-containing protein [Bacteroidota bacterium]MCA6452749.1 CAP domain-containing protein [Chitinophagaceae bacterium]MCA6456157.1 CAP domain-containing protein [Chitinophagaceae bacterium]MCA6457553.1 CAP domain-containing protein [Chitinophagaceae bacterium]
MNPWVFRIGCLVLGVGLLSCSPRTAGSLSANTGKETIVVAGMENAILQYINQHRSSIGKASLKLATVASEQAYRHSRNMGNRKTGFGHEGFDNRMEAIKKNVGWISASAENVAYGKLTAREVVQGWLNSPGHRKNIEGDYLYTGIGVYQDAKGILFFTQIFYRK